MPPDENGAAPDGLVQVPVDQHGRLHFEDAVFVIALIIAAPLVWTVGQAWLLGVLAEVPEPVVIALGIGGVLALGRGFYTFRSQARKLYGLLEVVVGLVAAMDGIRGLRTLGVAGLTFADGRTSLLTIAGAVYLVVRGLDNWHHAQWVPLVRKVHCPECAKEAARTSGGRDSGA